MAIMAMAMATVKRNNKNDYGYFVSVIALLPLLFTSSAVASEWSFVPSLEIEEIYSDNILGRSTNPQSSVVNQANAIIDTSYQSSITNFLLSAKKSYLTYNHDSSLNDNYLELDAEGFYTLWTEGPKLIASARIDNISRNTNDNYLADLVSGGTIQSKNYYTGLRYDFGNSNYTVNSSLIYNIVRYEDDIANNNGYISQIESENGSAAKSVFWKVSANYTKRTQDTNNIETEGKNYSIDAKIGAITPIAFNPFVRFYDEKVEGTNANNNLQSTPSWGPGIRWQASPHLIIDLSYNFVSDEAVSDNYVDTEINWEPSSRTSLSASFSQRFFGDSYELNFQHKTKRFTNSITYTDELDVYDRLSYATVDLGDYWCPIGIDINDVSQCSLESEPPTNIDNFALVPFSGLEPVNSNVYSLNKTLTWLSTLNLARTSFTYKMSDRERKSLDTGVIDDYFDASFTIERKSSAHSTFALSSAFKYTTFDKENPLGSRQKDYYRIVSLSYTRQLASSLSSLFTLRHVNRSSNRDDFSYKELRATINITKEF